ncbi:DUF899 family protein [Sphingopyxis sp.]|uniref:DUF899 family protein n=1 Tax=Sphingopyxis sp. TaxID=1908224 RepID=UPI002ED99BEB
MALRQTLSAAPALASRRRAFPGEDEAYTKARKSLLAEEIDLRRRMTRVAEQRRQLPPGPLMKDYRFKDANGAELGLADLFGEHDTLVSYFWMYGPERERPCPMCTNWLGSVDGNANDIKQRVAFKVFGRSPVERQKAFALERGWQALDFLQVVGNDYVRDFDLLMPGGGDLAAIVVYKRGKDGIRLFWKSDMTAGMADPGQDPRDAPDIAALWNILDLTPGGRGTDWYPSLEY